MPAAELHNARVSAATATLVAILRGLDNVDIRNRFFLDICKSLKILVVYSLNKEVNFCVYVEQGGFSFTTPTSGRQGDAPTIPLFNRPGAAWRDDR